VPTAIDKQDDLAAKVLNWFVYTTEHTNEKQFREDAEEDFKFQLGDQWDEKVKQQLKEKDHPILTINRIKKQVSSAVGHHLQNRKDIRPIPVDSSVHDLGISKLFQALVKHAMYQGSVHWHFDQAQKESVICGRGWLWASIDYTRDPMNGEPRIQWIPWRDVYCDPDSQLFDKSDATYIMRFAWMTQWELRERYPEKSDEIREGFGRLFTGEAGVTGLTEGDPRDPYRVMDMARHFIDKKNERIRVVECWYRAETRRKFIADRVQGKAEPFEGDEELFNSFRDTIGKVDPERAAGLTLENRKVTEIRFAIIAGGVNLMLDEGETPYKTEPLDRMLPGIPFIYERTDGVDEGLVRQLKDPQRETNKRRSKHMHLLNHLPPGIWIADEGAADPKALKKAMDTPNEIVWRRSGKSIERIEPTNPGEIFIHVDTQIKRDFFEIGINPDLMGLEGGGESGRAIMLKIGQGQLQLAEPMANLEWSYRILGIWLMGLIQITYNDPKVLQVMGPEGVEVLLEINQRDRGGDVQNFFTDLRNGDEPESFQDFRNIKYDVVVTTSSFAPTTRAMQFAMMVELAQAGYPIPVQAILEASDLPNKHDLIRQMGSITPSGPNQPSGVVQDANAQIGRQVPQ